MLRIGDQVHLINGFPFDSKHFNNDRVGKPLVRIRDILGEGLPTYFSGYEGLQVKVHDGDIAIGMDGDFNAKFWTKGEALLNQRVCAIKPKEKAKINFHYLAYCLPNGLKILNDLTHSTTVKHLASSDILSMRIPAPDSDTQLSIVSYLDRETRRIDDLIAEKSGFIALLQEKRVAEISHAVTKGINPDAPMKLSGVDWLGDVPAHWDTVRLGVIFKEADRRGDPTHPVLSVSIHDGVSDEEVADEDRVRKVALSEDRSVYQGVMPGDLVYNMMRAWQGGFGAVATEGLVSPAYVVARPLSDARTKFIELQLRTPQAVEEMRRYSKGIADFRMRLYWEHFRNVRVALPSPEEQDAILANIERETIRIDGLIHETEHSIALLKEKRAALITAAVTGKIDVRNAA